MFGRLAIVAVVLVLVGCGRTGVQTSRVQKPVPQETIDYLNSINILNTNDRAEAYKIPETGTSPFGVFVLKTASFTGMCSATHVREGLVLTAGHCITEPKNKMYIPQMDPDEYFVVYYDKTGTKRWARIADHGGLELVFHPGFHLIHDIMVAHIAKQDADQWDVLGGSMNSSDALWNTGQSHRITYWAWEPANPKQLKFKRASCNASINIPTIYGLTNVGTPNETKTKLNLGATPKYHLSLTDCDSLPVPGNSGAMLTFENRPLEQVGLFTAFTKLEQADLDTWTTYRREETDGTFKILTHPADFILDRLITLGYRFRHSLENYLAHDKLPSEAP